MPPLINEKCKRCGSCYDICPGDVFDWAGQKKKPVVRYPTECWHCGACRLECPAGAIDYQFPLGMIHL